MKPCFHFVTMIAVISVCDASMPPYIHTRAESRRQVLEYCRIVCENNSSEPRLSCRTTFEKALNGDFEALHRVFSDGTYHTDDSEWDEIRWHILQVVGDARFADFVLTRPVAERPKLVLIAPYVPFGEDAAFDEYFKKQFPRTYAFYHALCQGEPESNRFDYGPRHLGIALATQPRFADVRIHKSGKTGGTLITAPRSLSSGDRADLGALVRKHLHGKAEVVFQ